MTALAFATHLAFCAGLALLSALVVWGMTRVGVIDVPGQRSSHTRPTPKGGGVGIVAAFLVGMAVLYGFAAFARIADPYFRAVILAAAGIAIVAYLDDMFAWPAWVKLVAQLGAAAIAVGAGYSCGKSGSRFSARCSLAGWGRSSRWSGSWGRPTR